MQVSNDPSQVLKTESAELGIYKKNNQKYRLFKMNIVQELKENYKNRRKEFCETTLEKK